MRQAWHQNFKKATKEDRTSIDGITHRSVEEKARWMKLSFDQRLGLIRGLRREVAFPLAIDAVRAVLTPSRKQIARYTADFVYERHDPHTGEWVEVIEDHKGFMDKAAELRIAIFEAIYQKRVYIHKR